MSQVKEMLALTHKGNQKILESFHDDSIKLSEHLAQRKVRVMFVQQLKLTHDFTQSEIVKHLIKFTEQTEGKAISQATAYREYSFAMMIFGNADEVQIRGEIAVMKDLCMKEYRDAKKRGDEELAHKWYKEYRALFPKDVQDLKDYDPDKLEANEYKFVMQRETEKVVAEHFGSGSIDLNSFKPVDIEFEEIQDEDDTES